MSITREVASHEIHEIGKASELKNDSFESGVETKLGSSHLLVFVLDI